MRSWPLPTMFPYKTTKDQCFEGTFIAYFGYFSTVLFFAVQMHDKTWDTVSKIDLERGSLHSFENTVFMFSACVVVNCLVRRVVAAHGVQHRAINVTLP